MGKALTTINKVIDQIGADAFIRQSFPSTYTTGVANDLSDQIRKRTRLGYGVSSDSTQQGLAPLTQGYINQRRRSELFGQTTPAKSNLTRTGELLNAIAATGSPGVITVFINDSRSTGNIGNNKLREYVEEKRPFFALTKSERNNLIRTLKSQLLSTVQKLLRT